MQASLTVIGQVRYWWARSDPLPLVVVGTGGLVPTPYRWRWWVLVSTFRLPALFIYLSSGSIVVCIRGAAQSSGGFVPTPDSSWHPAQAVRYWSRGCGTEYDDWSLSSVIFLSYFIQ